MNLSITASPHEAFSLMLLERLERLEDAHRALENAYENLRFKVPYEWYKVTLKTPVSAGDDSDYYRVLRINWLNQLFSQRAIHSPRFAYWFWYIEGTDMSDAFHIEAYIQFKHTNTTLYDIQMFFDSFHLQMTTATPVQGGVAEVKMILEDRDSNHIDLFDSTDHYGANIWRRGGEAFDSPAPTTWTDGDFLDSPEYCPPNDPGREQFLDYLRLTILQKRWMALFQEEV